MSGFKIGDLVVKMGGPCTAMPKGTVCRVLYVRPAVVRGETVQALTLEGWDHRHPFCGWHGPNFRKIQKADDAFTAQMRALKPIKQKA